jgi:hypothetical protein
MQVVSTNREYPLSNIVFITDDEELFKEYCSVLKITGIFVEKNKVKNNQYMHNLSMLLSVLDEHCDEYIVSMDDDLLIVLMPLLNLIIKPKSKVMLKETLKRFSV